MRNHAGIKNTDATVTITFNNPRLLSAVHIMNDIWIQPRRVSDFYGHPVYRLYEGHREITVISNKALPLFIPVSREEFITVLIRNFEETIAEGQKQAAMTESRKKIFPGNDAENEKRKADFQRDYSRMHRFDPLLARRLKTSFDEAEKKLEEAQNDSTITFTISQFIDVQLSIWKEGIRKTSGRTQRDEPF
jgi:hypothetical protein